MRRALTAFLRTSRTRLHSGVRDEALRAGAVGAVQLRAAGGAERGRLVPPSRWLVLAGVILSGCDSMDDMPAVAVRDSLGVEIIDVDRRQIESEGRMSPSPEWIVGDGADWDGLVLHEVADVDWSGAGIVWIANGGSQEVIGVDVASGEVIRLGGRGDGPGELQGLSRVWSVAPGRVGAFDAWRRRYVEFSRDGALLREIPIPQIPEPPGLTGLYRVMDDEAGEIFYQAHITGLPPGPTDGPYRGRGPLVRHGGSADTLTWVPGITTHAGELAGAVLFGATTLLAEGPEGVWVGDSERPEVVLWRAGDRPERIVRWSPRERTELTEDRKSQFFSRLENSLPEEEWAMMAQMRDAFRFAETVPEFGSVQADAQGSVWIGPYVDPEYGVLEEPVPASEWLVIDVVKHEASRVQLPEGFQLLRPGPEFALGIHTDDLGVETVRLYRIESEGRLPE